MTHGIWIRHLCLLVIQGQFKNALVVFWLPKRLRDCGKRPLSGHVSNSSQPNSRPLFRLQINQNTFLYGIDNASETVLFSRSERIAEQMFVVTNVSVSWPESYIPYEHYITYQIAALRRSHSWGRYSGRLPLVWSPVCILLSGKSIKSLKLK